MSPHLLYATLALLMLDSITETALIVAMVEWLHRVAGKGFGVNYNDTTFILQGKPEHFLVNQGHASNGAAGTAFVVIGCGGILALALRNRQMKRYGGLSGFTKAFYTFWLYMTSISAVFSVAVLVYTFVETYTHTGQTINVALASRLHNEPYPNQVPYPRDSWTPQNWFPAFLELDIARQSDRDDIETYLTIMRAWQWNLIPMAVLSIVVSALAWVDRRRGQRVFRANGGFGGERGKPGSPYSS
jgi:hypothetical protein